MLDPTTLYRYHSHVDQRRVHARTLLVTLGSYLDAGHTQRLLVDHLENTLTSHSLAEFDVDQLVDLRENRPHIVFDRDHFTDYMQPQITLTQFFDAGGEAFLVLAGPEPALQWERMAAAVKRIVDELDVHLVVTAQGVPLPTPHTRPVLLTKHASRADLIPGNQPLFGQMLMGASFPAMLETRLAEAGVDVVGLSAHVPQYLVDTDFPDAPVTVIQSLRDLTGLRIPTETLAVAAGIVRAQLGAQISQSEELTQMVEAMEEQYDQAVSHRELTRQAEENLPDADAIGEEAEAFLRDLGDGPRGPQVTLDGHTDAPAAGDDEPGQQPSPEQGPDDPDSAPPAA